MGQNTWNIKEERLSWYLGCGNQVKHDKIDDKAMAPQEQPCKIKNP
jgi:hypothetical protein